MESQDLEEQQRKLKVIFARKRKDVEPKFDMW